MLLFGSTNIGAGGSAAQLWKLTAAAPADIDIDAANGAAGINAALPSNDKMKVILSDAFVPGQKLFAAGYIDFAGNEIAIVTADENRTVSLQYADLSTAARNGVDVDASAAAIYTESASGDEQAAIVVQPFNITAGAQDNATNEDAQLNLSPGVAEMNVHNHPAAGDQSRITLQGDNIIMILDNSTGACGGAFQISNSGATVSFIDPGTNLLLIQHYLTGDKFRIADAVPGSYCFEITAAGRISTNQVAASVAVRAKVGEIPIFDTAGILKGYIDINF